MSRSLGIIGSNLMPGGGGGSGGNSVGSVGASSQLAAALLDHQKSVKTRERELTAHTITLSSGSGGSVSDHPSPRPSRKLHHPFKSSSGSGSSMMGTGGGVKKSSSVGAANIGPPQQMMMMGSPPESPTFQNVQMRRFK